MAAFSHEWHQKYLVHRRFSLHNFRTRLQCASTGRASWNYRAARFPAIAAAIAAVGTSIAVPGLGLVVAGPLAAALAGAGAGGAAGGLVGALIGAGIPEERVKHYEKGLKEGGILMGVRPRTEEDAGYFESEWSKAGGTHVYR